MPTKEELEQANVAKGFNQQPGLFDNLKAMLGGGQVDPAVLAAQQEAARQAEYEKIRQQNGQNFGR